MRTHRLALVVLAVPALAAGLSVSGCGRPQRAVPRVVILGLDGMDYDLTTRMIEEGRLPGLERLAKMGGFAPLGTAIPAQSPVAWSDFTTGHDAGVHGIFDFIHRDPSTMEPYLSTSRTDPPKHVLSFGGWQFPLSSGRVELLRRGRAFWEVLEQHGVPTAVLRIPADFPPSGTAGHELSGMGTPDVLGGYGTFSYYTSDRLAFLGQTISGGHVYRVEETDGVVHAQLVGPDHPLKRTPEKLTADLTVYLDPDRPVVKIVVGDEERVLQQGEWSDWVPISFDLMPTQHLPVQARFYLKQVRPQLGLYVSPLNFDPYAPALPISRPASFAGELADACGRFYTQGMPEAYAALNAGVFTRDEFLAQARIAGREIQDELPYALRRFDRGLLFFYEGNTDLVGHMLWRPMDPGHPAYDPVADPPYADAVPQTYVKADELVTYTLDHVSPDTLVIAMSDHGFTSWRRTFHLNAWLHQHGYLAVKDESLPPGRELLTNVDWTRTRAYGFGLNALYVNLRGREKDGLVDAADRDRLLAEIKKELEATIDPWNGKPAVGHVYLRDQTYTDGGQRAIGPDAVVGYAKGTRGSDESALGEVEKEVLTSNDKPWSGDHEMDTPSVPGILATSRPLKRPAANLRELNASVLAEYGIDVGPAGVAQPTK
ncbi:MAG TPA: alkaline phosphatase family protein [Vicinamibacteria bacterium]|nr:alkaline phosphatase family protein [Vicinamibacteria bacterium]